MKLCEHFVTFTKPHMKVGSENFVNILILDKTGLMWYYNKVNLGYFAYRCCRVESWTL